MNKHISEDGKIRNCHAEPGKCPVKAPDGESYHSDNTEELLKLNETIQNKKFGETKTLSKKSMNNKKYTQTQLNSIAKNSHSKEQIDLVINQGGARALNSLSKNPLLTREQLLEIEDKVTNKNTINNLKQNHNYPIERLNDSELRKRSSAVISAQFEKNPPTDEMIERIKRTHGSYQTVKALKHDENISQPIFDSIVQENINKIDADTFKELKNNPRFDFKKIIASSDTKNLYRLIHTLKDPKDIEVVYNDMNSRADIKHGQYDLDFIYNENTPNNIIREISNKEETVKSNQKSIGLYKRYKSDKNVMNSIKENKAVKSMVKLEKIDKEVGLNSIRGVSTKKAAYNFDPVKVKKYGLSSEDIDVLVRYKYNDWLWHTSYNENTGEYIGYND